MKTNKKGASELIIRKFTMNDYRPVVALWKEAQLPYRPQGRDSRRDIQRQIQQTCTMYLVAEINGRIVGTIFGTHDSRKGWINRLAVSPDHRKKGIAAALVATLEEHFTKLGIDIAACLIEEWNGTSMNVFEQLGYKKYPDVLYFTKRKNSKI
jgi:N-acetylglutamate synthase